jgi:hypothetical protein
MSLHSTSSTGGVVMTPTALNQESPNLNSNQRQIVTPCSSEQIQLIKAVLDYRFDGSELYVNFLAQCSPLTQQFQR